MLLSRFSQYSSGIIRSRSDVAGNLNKTACIVAVAALVNSVLTPAFAGPGQISHAQDEKDIRAQAAQYAAAFANADSAAMSGMWAADAVLTDQSGRVLKGRDAIAKEMDAFFKNAGKQPMEISVEAVDFPSDDIAIERGTSRLTGAGSSAWTRYTAVHAKRDGKWQMVNVSEVAYVPAPSPEAVTDLGWLIGSWRAEGPGGVMTLKSNWAADKRVIRCDFVTNLTDGTTRNTTQFIYFDPVSNEIRSWQYDGTGGYGQSSWRGSRGDWAASACSVQADGSTGTARYLLSKVDDNSFIWQSTRRTLLGRSLPDTAKLVVKRAN